MAWGGYFLKNAITNTVFNNHLIQWDSYLSTPNQREEIKAYRDEVTRQLYRVTATGHKTKIEFTTIPYLNGLQKVAIQSFFREQSPDWNQRKCQLTYWNDEDNTYYTSYFYVPDITFKVHHLDHNNNPIYEALEIHLIEY